MPMSEVQRRYNVRKIFSVEDRKKINEVSLIYFQHASVTQDVNTDSLTGFLGWINNILTEEYEIKS